MEPHRRAGVRRTMRASSLARALVLGVLPACAGARVEEPARILEHARPSAAPLATPDLTPDPTPDPAPTWAPGGALPVPSEGGPLSLADVLARIAQANPTLGAAQARLASAAAARREVVASYYPELSLGLDVLSTDTPSLAFGILLDQQDLTLGPAFDPTPGTVTNWRKELRLDWALFTPGRGQTRQAAEAGEEAAELAREAIERRLLNAGVQAWIGIGAAQALAAVAEESVAVVERRRTETDTRWQAGAALRADVLRLEVRLAAARQEAARARLAVREAESGLNLLMGAPPAAPLALRPEELAIGIELPEELTELQALAEEERLDLQAAAYGVRRVQLEHAAARALRSPWLRAFAAYDVDGPEPAIETEFDSVTLGLGLRLPLSARTGARIRRAEAEARRAEEELRALALAVAGEVRTAFETLAVASETRALAETAVGSAEEAFRIVAEAQDAGAATVTDVLEAEDARKQARARVAAARAGVELARTRLVAATGGVR